MSVTSSTEAGIVSTIQELGPRAKAFVEKSKSAKDKIIAKVLTALIEGSKLSGKDFIAKHVTDAGQQEISSLDQRVHILFQNIVLQAFADIIKDQKTFMGMLMISATVRDLKAHTKFFKEAALPVIKELIADLDTNFPGVVDEAVSTGIEQPEIQRQFGLL